MLFEGASPQLVSMTGIVSSKVLHDQSLEVIATKIPVSQQAKCVATIECAKSVSLQIQLVRKVHFSDLRAIADICAI